MEDSPSKKRRKIKFKEITTTLSKDELIRRLKAAAQELTDIDQGENTPELDEFTASLVTSFILKHRDKDVKSYASCCLVDVLRIYAPEPPYNEKQLKDVFRLILQQLKGLEVIQGPSYKRHFYILESLALVKTFNVCMELDAQDIIVDLFKLFFTVISEEHNVRVKNFMLDVMAPLIQEGESLPQEVLDVIMVHLIDPRKTKSKAGYKLACDIIDKCSSTIEPYVQLFFNNALVLGNPVAQDLGDNLYELVFELYKVNKSVLLSVLPQLEFKLKGNDEDARLEAVKLLGRIFVEEDGTDLAESNKALWSCYLGRFLDISTDIRIECIQMAKQFLLSPSLNLRLSVTEQLCNRFHDPDEKVRLEAVVTACEAAGENFQVIEQKLIDGVQERMRDKKWLIRREAVTCIGKLYKRVMTSTTDKSVLQGMLSFPSKVLHLYQNTIEDRLCIERVFHGCFVPVSLDMEERMKRFFRVYLSLDDVAAKVLDGMFKYRSRINMDLRSLLETLDLEENEDKDKIFFRRVVAVARNLPEPYKSQEHLKKLLVYCSDKKTLQLLNTCTDVNGECSKIIKAVTELIKKLTAKNPILDTVKALLDRACPMLIDKSSFVILLKYVKRYIDGLADDDDEEEEDEYDLLIKGKHGLKLIQTLSSVQPSVFQSKQSYEVLLQLINHDNNDVVQLTLCALEHVISELESVDKNLCSCYQPVLSKLAVNGTYKQAKHALRCVNKMLTDSTLVLERIFKNLLDNLNFDSTLSRLRATLSALGEMAVIAPLIFESKHTIIIRDFLVKKVLVVDWEKDKTDSQDSEEDEWCRDSDVSEQTLVKMEAIKLLTKWLNGLENDQTEKAMPVLRLLITLLAQDGDLSGEGNISAPNRSRLRETAASAMLQLAQNTIYIDVITLEQYQQLALVMQDSCFEVRELFTSNLHRGLESLQLSLAYMALFALVAAEPSKERKNKVKQMITKNANTRREYSKQHSAAAARPYNVLPEYSLPYVIHLLAHHPDFDHTNIESLQQTKEYVWFFLEPIMGVKAENYSFLKKLLENIKQTKDKQDPDNATANEKLYAVCDLAVSCIMNKNNTFTLKDFPGKLVLPKKLFIEDKTIDSNKTYLPKDFVLSPKKQKLALDVKAVSVKELVPPKKTPSKKATKRSNTVDIEEGDDESPRKKARVSSSKKKTEVAKKPPAATAVRNLGKENVLLSPKKKNSPVKSPKKSPKKSAVTSRVKASPVKKSPAKKVATSKKTPVKKISSPKKKSPVKSASPKKSPVKKGTAKPAIKKQSKLDSFVKTANGKKRNATQEEEILDEKPAKSRKSPTKAQHSKTRMGAKKSFQSEEMNGSVSDISDEVSGSNTPNGNIADEKPGKLMVRRKQRSRR